MLYRVQNLSKSTDKRLQNEYSFQYRTKGNVGVAVNPIEGDGFEDIYWLKGKRGDNLGIYRIEELEEVTEKQLQLEIDLAALLTIFPNKSPHTVLSMDTTVLSDDLTVKMLVPVLRKRYKKEFAY